MIVNLHSLAPHFCPLYQCMKKLLKRLCSKLSLKLPYWILFQLNFFTKTRKFFSRQSRTFSMNHWLRAPFPLILKTAVVRPLLKKPSLEPNDLKNYRPISNLPFLSKLVEELVFQQLASHLSTHHVLSISLLTGSGTARRLFSSAYSTIFSLPSMTKTFLSACFLGLSAAFNTIDHEILLPGLQHDFGIRNTAVD